MSADASTDPVPYRKDLRKNMGLEDQDSKNTDDQKGSSNNKNFSKSIE